MHDLVKNLTEQKLQKSLFFKFIIQVIIRFIKFTLIRAMK
jgi:hypothetical protein